MAGASGCAWHTARVIGHVLPPAALRSQGGSLNLFAGKPIQRSRRLAGATRAPKGSFSMKLQRSVSFFLLAMGSWACGGGGSSEFPDQGATGGAPGGAGGTQGSGTNQGAGGS